VVAAKWALYSMVASHRWRTALSWWWGLWAPRILQIPHFRNPKGSRLLRVPQFGPHNPAMGVLKSPGPRSEQGVLAVPLLTSIFGSWHLGSWNYKWLVYLQHLCHLRLFSPFESHTSGGVPSSYGSSRGLFPQSHHWRARKLQVRREVRLFIGWNSVSLNVLLIWVPGHSSVPGNVTMFFTTTTVCYSILWGLEFY